jgi:glycosyltransferase involved in cell wall biosynthesis
MHIVQLLPELKQGGVETIVLSLNRELVKRGHRSTVISKGGDLVEQIEKDGGEHITLDICSKNLLTLPHRTRQLQIILSKLQPDILHAHSRIPAWMVWFANKRLKIPWVTTVHGFNSVSRYSEIMTKGDRVICVSHPVKEYVLNHYSPDPSKTRVVHCGIAINRFDPARLDQQKLNELESELDTAGKFIITSVGRITELKDYETFIRAIALVHKSNPRVRGLIVGDVRKNKQNYYLRLQQLTKELHMQNHIHFSTQCTSMPELYAISDVVVSCSKKPESFGLTLIEALAMNTPVIATRHGGPLDIIKEGENGHFFEKENASQLAALLIKNNVEKKDLRTDIANRFSMEKMVDSTLSVYHSIQKHD